MIMRKRKYPFAGAVLLAGAAALSGCGGAGDPPAPTPDEDGEARSIFRPEFQTEPGARAEQSASLTARIDFPEGNELTQAARAELATVAGSPQVQAGNQIILRGHSDAGGSDAVNMRASIARAEAARDFLVELGVPVDRITIIGFGEQNPVAPNALPDGTPDEKGRAANRRVDIEVDAAQAPPKADPTDATLAETLAETISAEESSPN